MKKIIARIVLGVTIAVIPLVLCVMICYINGAMDQLYPLVRFIYMYMVVMGICASVLIWAIINSTS